MQRIAPGGKREVLAGEDGDIRVVEGVNDTRTLALRAIDRGHSLAEEIADCGRGEQVDVAEELEAGRLLAPLDHPDPAHLLLAGTGLTHLGSAEGRDRMHRAADAGETLTDSMRIFLEGLQGGKPAEGAIGQQPEWFFKGNGEHLVGPEMPLDMPGYAQDGGDEPEIAGLYLIGPDGTPFRLGFCLANEYSDHVTEKHNYLWLAHSKLRQAALGPELLTGMLPADIRGTCRIRRAGAVAWEKPFLTGEDNMSHALANLEHHHFKYPLFRRPGDVHVHFFGTSTASFADGFATQDGDVFEIEAPPFTLPLRNPLRKLPVESAPIRVVPL
ncbi:AraD1 family protein [Croceibacterium aestuarii]|uniref:AraD1 family protein n=1 Tax=Croceibacterium aestuarii TaxID=3064139 RepID=UPI003F6F3E4B